MAKNQSYSTANLPKFQKSQFDLPPKKQPQAYGSVASSSLDLGAVLPKGTIKTTPTKTLFTHSTEGIVSTQNYEFVFRLFRGLVSGLIEMGWLPESKTSPHPYMVWDFQNESKRIAQMRHEFLVEANTYAVYASSIKVEKDEYKGWIVVRAVLSLLNCQGVCTSLDAGPSLHDLNVLAHFGVGLGKVGPVKVSQSVFDNTGYHDVGRAKFELVFNVPVQVLEFDQTGGSAETYVNAKVPMCHGLHI